MQNVARSTRSTTAPRQIGSILDDACAHRPRIASSKGTRSSQRPGLDARRKTPRWRSLSRQYQAAGEEWRFFDVSSGLEQVSQGRGDHVDHGREGCDVAISASTGPGGLEQAVEPFETGIAV